VPIEYVIDSERRTVRTKGVGYVTLQEVIDHFRTLEQDPQCPEHANVFLDLSAVSSLPESHQISRVVTELKKFRGKVLFDACAVLASGDALFGMMRVFEVLAEDVFRVTRIFRIAAEAEEWLMMQQSVADRKSLDVE
jgi:hypothetical protein